MHIFPFLLPNVVWHRFYSILDLNILYGQKGSSLWLFLHLFLLVGGWLLYNIVVVFVIHWHESAMD